MAGMGEATTPPLPQDLASFRQLVSQPLLLQSPLQVLCISRDAAIPG
jgi:hypothetical protein